jgi:hypothetical protein
MRVMNLPRKETNEILFLIVLDIKDEVREMLLKPGPDRECFFGISDAHTKRKSKRDISTQSWLIKLGD